VHLLDGGFDAWQRAGLPYEAGPATSTPAEAFGAPFPGCPQFLVDLSQAKALLKQPGGALVSIRTWAEFSGVSSGYSYIAAKGDIPGALWGHADAAGRHAATHLPPDVNDMGAFHTPEGCMLPADVIARLWHSEGITPDQQIAFYCGTGWRASLAFFYAWLMGWERISVFDGGWLEWSQTDAALD
jgi:3-mercaptopyruvate sulfurtransferase SseA